MKISERQIVGMILAGIPEVTDKGWVGALGMEMSSDQASEEYAWLGASPAMREWIGGRNAKGFVENSFSIRNKKFEATMEVCFNSILV